MKLLLKINQGTPNSKRKAGAGPRRPLPWRAGSRLTDATLHNAYRSQLSARYSSHSTAARPAFRGRACSPSTVSEIERTVGRCGGDGCESWVSWERVVEGPPVGCEISGSSDLGGGGRDLNSIDPLFTLLGGVPVVDEL